MAIIGFSIPNINTPLFKYGTNECTISRLGFPPFPVPVLDYGFGLGYVNCYGNFVESLNQAFINCSAATGLGVAPPFMVYTPATRLFTLSISSGDTSTWFMNLALYSRFPTLPAVIAQDNLSEYAQLRFISPARVCAQEVPALWALNDYSRLVITAPGLPFDPTYSAVSQSGTPLSLRTLASFENSDTEFNRSAFVYSESGQGNWTLHDLKMSGSLQTIQLQVFAVNFNDEVFPVKLYPGKQAIIKLAFVRDDARIL
jgi:hypothetical protein